LTRSRFTGSLAKAEAAVRPSRGNPISKYFFIKVSKN
jgi:hypothetical protein